MIEVLPPDTRHGPHVSGRHQSRLGQRPVGPSQDVLGLGVHNRIGCGQGVDLHANQDIARLWIGHSWFLATSEYGVVQVADQ